MKKLKLLCISSIVLMLYCSSVVSAESDVITALGIFENTVDVEEHISRADFASVLYRVVNYEEKDNVPVASKQYYTDVDRQHWAAGYIQSLTQDNVLHGYDDNSYRPDNYVTLGEASRVIVDLLGYGAYIESVGYSMYQEIAVKDGLLKGISLQWDDELAYGDVKQLLKNTLDANCIEAVLTSGKISYTKGEDFLYHVMGLKKESGIITACGMASIDGKALAEGNITIGGMTFVNKIQNAYDMIGYNVEYYYSDEDEMIAYAAVEKKQNNILLLDRYDILSYADRKYTYEAEESERAKIASIAADFYFMYNGELGTDESELIPDYGTVKLIDNDNDSEYDVVIVSSIQNIVVEKVDAEKKIIYAKNKTAGGASVLVELEDYEICDIKGAVKDIANLKENMVIGVQSAKGKSRIILNVTEETIEGTVNNVDNSEQWSIITVDDKEYYIAVSPYMQYWNYDLNATVQVMIDSLGKIAGVISQSSGEFRFAYVVRGYWDHDEEAVGVKLLDQSGEFVRLLCAEKAYLNGEHTAHSLIYDELQTQQLIRYKTTSTGEMIKYIDTAQQLSLTDRTNGNLKDKDKLLLRVKGQTLHTHKFENYIYTMDMPGDAVYDSATKIFMVDMGGSTAEEDYRVITDGQVPTDYQPITLGYNTDDDMLLMEAIVIEKKANALSHSSPVAMISKVITTINDDNEICYEILGFSSGTEIKLMADDESIITKSNGKLLERGDIIQFSKDLNGNLGAVMVLYATDNVGTLNTSFVYSTDSTPHANFRARLGYIYKEDNGYLLFKNLNGAADEVVDSKKSRIYVYNEDEKNVEMGNIYDIKTYMDSNSSYDDVVFTSRASNVYELFIIKKY